MEATEKPTRPCGADQLLLKLHLDGRVEVLVLTQVQPGTRSRLRRFACAIVETPSFPSLEADA